MHKPQKRLTALMLAMLFALTMLLPAATGIAEADKYLHREQHYITPHASDGVLLTYEEGLNVLGTAEYGMLTFNETKDIVINASFEPGWVYNRDYCVFFENNQEHVEISQNADGSVVFVFHAIAGNSVALSEISSIGIYASASQLPRLEISIDIPFSMVDKETWVDAQFNLTLGTKQFESGSYTGTGSVKGRGNTSWDQPKKPYSIKLDSKASLLDIPNTKKYAIVPSYADQSLLRNYITYKAGLMLDGIDYTPKCEFVEVYLNGAYNGIYLLVERVDIESTKVDIEEADATNLTGGYLFEKDIDGKIDFGSDLWFNCPYWANQSRDYFVLKTPEPDDPELTRQMLDYLENHMQLLHDSIIGTSGESYTDYIDVDSWIDFILIQEITKNIDGNLKTSCYMYKDRDDDHIYMTAPWDFDLAYGIANWNNADHTHNDYYDCPSGTGVTGFMAINSSSPWFDHLYDDYPEFREALINKYRQYRETIIPAMRAMISEQSAYLDIAAVRNDSMWYTDSEYGTEELINWFDGRINWLDGQWAETHDDIDIDLALNVDGGSLHFDTSMWTYPFEGTVFGGRLAAKSSIEGLDYGECGMNLTLDMAAGEELSFDYYVSSERGYDIFSFGVGSNALLDVSGSDNSQWQSYTFVAQTAGTYEFYWSYIKDASESHGMDCALVDNVAYSGTQYPMGDVDLDGVVTIADALLIMRHAMGLVTLQGTAAELADYDGNGEIAVADAIVALRYAIGLT